MGRQFINRSIAVLAAFILYAAPISVAQSQDATANDTAAASSSRLPLPRFVSLKAERANLRVGPGRDFPISWLFTKRGLPMEIIQEFEQWRRVRDSEGSEGWIYYSLLSGERSAIAAPWLSGQDVHIDVRRNNVEEAAVVARLEPGVVMKVENCTGTWCRVDVADRKGFVAQNQLWGVYPDEVF
ncbi:SH3 domain-containing protein [Aureimonas fodinaquatilis]|uniref:SH3 domain-containing protein n=1 Tax=Aureimonas fodinaquatilis TaxID=2565783 RepID=UPI001FEC4362|nr:SH3 domain-containing protein [Aureimonas fodinaquatilis]